jgi:hypothetical protein
VERKRDNVLELPFAFDLRNRDMQKVADRLAREIGGCRFCGSNEVEGRVAECYQPGELLELKPVVLCPGCKKWLTD